jgi:flagellar basal body rod protein FlgC
MMGDIFKVGLNVSFNNIQVLKEMWEKKSSRKAYVTNEEIPSNSQLVLRDFL